MTRRSLHSGSHPLAAPEEQLRHLEERVAVTFDEKLKQQGVGPLMTTRPEILQINVGYRCNQTCKHCHVDAGPDRTEQMSEETIGHVLEWLRCGQFKCLDITGGAPEMHPKFRWLIDEARKFFTGEIIVRSNLTILVANPVYKELPGFFRDRGIRVCSSLPFYQADRTDRQRGDGVFEKSIRALRALNDVGYGKPETGLVLDLVYNPAGAFLPGDQHELERSFREALRADHGIEFTNLFVITNVPVSRFLDFLIQSGNLEGYMEKLVSQFNPSAVNGLMCRTTVSVDWQGNLYDCDFNQMLGLKSNVPKPNIRHTEPETLHDRRVVTRPHCFACTAGQGSSCQGATV